MNESKEESSIEKENRDSSFIDKLNKNKYWVLGLGVATLFSSLLALAIFFPAAKRPLYVVKSFNLIKDSSSTIDNLEIKYRSCNQNEECKLEDIKQLTVSRILFWNGGRKKINKTDVDDNPIAIEAGVDQQNKILKAEIIATSNPQANIRLDAETNNILFSFLDPGNTILIEVIHTGLSDKDVVLSGYVEESLFDGEIKKLQLSSDGEIILLGLFENVIIVLYSALITTLVYVAIEVKSYKIKIILVFALFPFIFIIFFSSRVNKIYFRYSADLFKVFNSEIDSVTN